MPDWYIYNIDIKKTHFNDTNLQVSSMTNVIIKYKIKFCLKYLNDLTHNLNNNYFFLNIIADGNFSFKSGNTKI